MQSSQIGHFALLQRLYLHYVFLLLLGHLSQHTKAPLLFANNVPGECATLPSDGISHTVVISICKGRARGKRSRVTVQEVMSAFPSYIKHFVLSITCSFFFCKLFLYLM